MRIYNEDENKTINNLTLLLTMKEANELIESIKGIIKRNKQNDHEHINDQECNHEITISIYNENNTNEYNQRIQEVIKNDK